MQFREHRGSLDNSMETVVELADHAALMDHLRALAKPWPTFPPINEKTVSVVPYCRDERIGWDTHIVRLVGYGVLGYTDGPA
ncbi:MAG: hypothetical protein WAW79_11515 [Steroidobacteraceae bacterium]